MLDSSPLSKRRIIVGVSGGIAAYKSAELVRRLCQSGASVRVVMTRGAQAFVTPLTFQALTGEKVYTALLDLEAEAAMGHIELARWADLVLVAPASANTLARLACGIADDLLSTLCLATTAQIFVAPAMNSLMWDNLATQHNCRVLSQRGVSVIEPGSGELACGEIGAGRMPEADSLVNILEASVAKGELRGKKVVISAGPTREAIDPVRYISNRSSGKMGYALAAAAARMGAQVVLVSGPTNLDSPKNAARINVESAEQMRAAVQAEMPGCDVFIGAAAVADYSPTHQKSQKIKKSEAEFNLTMTRTVDILAEVANHINSPFTVGFAAETDNLVDYAKAKLEKKSLDMIAANWVGREGSGFDVDQNALSVFWAGGRLEIAQADKTEVAVRLMAVIVEKYNEKNRS